MSKCDLSQIIDAASMNEKKVDYLLRNILCFIWLRAKKKHSTFIFSISALIQL